MSRGSRIGSAWCVWVVASNRMAGRHPLVGAWPLRIRLSTHLPRPEMTGWL